LRNMKWRLMLQLLVLGALGGCLFISFSGSDRTADKLLHSHSNATSSTAPVIIIGADPATAFRSEGMANHRDRAGNFQLDGDENEPASKTKEQLQAEEARRYASVVNQFCTKTGNSSEEPHINEIHFAEDHPEFSENFTATMFCLPGRHTVLRTRPALPMCVHPKKEDTYISNRIFDGLLWDESILMKMDDMIRTKPKGIVIDAGANIGQFTFAAAALGHQVFALEPAETNLKYFEKSVSLNHARNFRTLIRLFKNGLSNCPSTKRLWIPSNNKGASQIQKRDQTEDQISIITLDDILPIINANYSHLPVYALKADIESFEARMLMGAAKFLSEKKPPLILLEIQMTNLAIQGCSVEQTLTGMLKLGYDIETSSGKLKTDGEVRHWVSMHRRFPNTLDIFLYLRS